MRVAMPVLGVGLGADQVETPGQVQSEKAVEIHIATIHDVKGPGLW
jgi:hypothetical protein